VDVQTDPQLSAACALDLQLHCAHVPRGNGQQMACLTQLKDPTQKCKDILTLRLKMMTAALKVVPAVPVRTAEDLVNVVRDSPSRDYLVLLVFAILACIFFGGLCCGRVTKRTSYSQKIK